MIPMNRSTWMALIVITLCSALMGIAILIYEDPRMNIHYVMSYDSGLFAWGKGTGYFKAEFSSINLRSGHTEAAWWQPIDRSQPWIVLLDGQEYTLSELTREKLMEMEPKVEKWEDGTEYLLIVRGECAFGMGYIGNDLVQVGYHYSGPLRGDQCKQIGMRWDGSDVFYLPLSKRELVKVLGTPVSVEETRNPFQ